jgi:hypothetical protein
VKVPVAVSDWLFAFPSSIGPYLIATHRNLFFRQS